MRLVLAIALLLASGLPARAEGTGAEAYEAKNFATARALWTSEADAGSADAMLGLGLIADYGLAGTRSPEQAFEWYSRAAAAGLAEAQFNLAVMFDAGRDIPRDAEAAALWYTRAALRGHARAKFNLALLYETGDGVPQAPDAAVYWYEEASEDLPAAGGRAARIEVLAEDRGAAAKPPMLLHAESRNEKLELVWLPWSAGEDALQIEVLTLQQAGYTAANVLPARGTGQFVELEDDGAKFARLLSVNADASDYSASNWLGADAGPRGRIRIQFDDRDPALKIAAEVFANDLAGAGFWVRSDGSVRTAEAGPPVSIAYQYSSDEIIAQLLASYLPVAETEFASPSVQLSPGEVSIILRNGKYGWH